MNTTKVNFLCEFNISTDYNKFNFRINEAIINDTKQNVNSDWFTCYFNKPLDIEIIKFSDVQIEYEDEYLCINDDKYRIAIDMFSDFALELQVDVDSAIKTVIIHFCEWLIENINDL